MKAHFNLVDEPWIPCVELRDGQSRDLSIREVLARAPELQEIDDASPLVTISIYRLLLAILHRNFGPEDMESWYELWQRGAWDTATLVEYFDDLERYHRFDLFGERPFYQCASLDITAPKPIALLAHELASGNNATLFDHTSEDNPPAVSPAQAARYLLAYHGFAFGGRITGESESGKAGPLTKGALVLVRGTNLFETLALNLHRYNDAHPFRRQPNDAAAWERLEETQAAERRPNGYLDLLTWQSRRVRLIPDSDDAQNIVVRFVSVRKGYQFPDDFYRRDAETMVAFTAREKREANGDPYPPVILQEDRAVWRDSHALFESSDEKHRPKMLDWLNDLAQEGYVERRQTRSLDVYGLCADQAKAILWRHERLPLPLVYLSDKELRDSLKLALDLGDKASTDVRGAIGHLANALRTPDLARNLAPSRLYWTLLETRFRQFLRDAPENRREAFARWRDEVRTAALGSFVEAARGLDTSARLLQATVAAERELHRRLRKTLGQYQPFKQGDAA